MKAFYNRFLHSADYWKYNEMQINSELHIYKQGNQIIIQMFQCNKSIQ